MIHGLLPSLMEIGRIKLGQRGKEVTSKDGKPFRLPEKLAYFRLTTTEKNPETDDFITDTEMMEILKEGGKAVYNTKGELIGIPIRLLYNTIDMNISTQYVSYVGGRLTCSGDGQKAHTRDGRDVPCPCKRLDGTYQGKDRCKLYSVLSVLIEGSRIGSCWKLRTTSKNTAKHLISSMLLIKALTGGLLAFLPLQLVVRPKKTMIPGSGQSTTVYVASIEYPGGIEELQKKALEMGTEAQKLISNMHDIEAETRRIVAPVDNEKEEYETATEFFPDSIELAPDQPDQDIEIRESATPIAKEVVDEETEKAKKLKAQEVINKENNAKIEKAKKLNKAKAAKEEAEAKKATSKTVKAPDKEEPRPEKDNLLGTPTPVITPEPEPKPEPEPEPEPTPKPEPTETPKPAAAAAAATPITREQLKKILNLKVVTLQINDQKAWAKLIKDTKFPNVIKANDMTTEQGDKFIKHLEALCEVPF